MVSISTPTFDLNGQVVLNRTEKSNLYAQSRRVTRTATLDGGVSLQDMGFSHGDRTLSVVSRGITESDYNAISYLEKNYPQLMISIHEGIFLGAIENITIRSGDLYINYFVKEKLNSE